MGQDRSDALTPRDPSEFYAEGIRLLLAAHKVDLPGKYVPAIAGAQSSCRQQTLADLKKQGVKVVADRASWADLTGANLPVLALAAQSSFLILDVRETSAKVRYPFLFDLWLMRDWLEERWKGDIIRVAMPANDSQTPGVPSAPGELSCEHG